MGSSAQQHRVAIGSFAGLLAGKSWRSRPKSWSRKKRQRCHSQAELQVLQSEIAFLWLASLSILMNVMWNVLTLLIITMFVWVGLENVLDNPTSLPYILLAHNQSDQYTMVSPWVSRLLLLTAGDIETNPGPASTEEGASPVVDSLTKALAALVGQAPSSEVRSLISTWAPDKPTITADLNKFKVPALKEALAWLWNREITDKVVSRKNKPELIECVIIAIEVLLPDTCSVCSEEYSTGRGETPSLRCKGCYQGFHQPCLEQLLGGQKDLPKLPGSLYWLCAMCSPNYELMTTTSGAKPTSVRKRLAPAHGLDKCEEHDSIALPQLVPPKNLPPPNIRSGLPYLWSDQPVAGQPDSDSGSGSNNIVQGVNKTPLPPRPPVPPTAVVRAGLPFLWATKGTVCQLYLKGDCPHGVSGKSNGGCSELHSKRCSKYMRWGSKHEKGCSSSTCEFVHPFLCPKSLDLKCTDQACPYKLHTLKCRRYETGNRSYTPGHRPDQFGAGQGVHNSGGVRHYGQSANYGTSRRPAWPGGHQPQPAWSSGQQQSSAGWGRSYPYPAVWTSEHQHAGRVQQFQANPLAGPQEESWGGAPRCHQGQPGQDVGLQGHSVRVPHGQAELSGGHQGQLGRDGGQQGQSGGVDSNQGFQGMTVQQLLEAHAINLGKELVKQREELRLIQQQIKQHQLPYPAAERWEICPNLSY